MRDIPEEISARLSSRAQTPANNSDPSLDLWISRPANPITDNHFLERQIVSLGGDYSAADVAVRHTEQNRQSDRIFIAYIDFAGAHVVSAAFSEAIENHTWTTADFNENATDIAIAFDGKMKKLARGRSEFITESTPWVFWVFGGKLWAQKLGDPSTRAELASANCTDVTAIRATNSGEGSFDFGLICFFIVNGEIYYRQLIGGEWYDAELVSYGPSVTWTDIAASRTWDYRTVLQAQDSDGNVYELYSQYQGIGKHLTEHIDISGISATASLIPITYRSAKEDEHIEISGITAGALYGGLYRTGAAQIIGAYNVPETIDEDENWGKTCIFVFDRHLIAADVAANAAAFSIVDSNNIAYTPHTAELQSDGLTVKLSFVNFNNASGVCAATYTPGTAKSMAGVAIALTSFAFTPQNLTPSEIPVPAPSEAWNTDTDGQKVAIRFTHPLEGSVSGNQSAFSLSFEEYNYVPGGAASVVTRSVLSVEAGEDDDEIILNLPAGNMSSIQNAAGDVTITYTGAGTLAGEGGPVAAFEFDFTPVGLVFKGGQHDIEHVELSGITAITNLMHIYYTNVKEDEHIEISGITAVGKLTDIHDI